MPPITPKLRVPIEFDGTSGFRTVEQDSVDEVRACVYAVLATPVGARIDEPDFGVEDPSFDALPEDPSEWLEAIATWEPRAEVAITQNVIEFLDNVTVAVAAR